MENNIYIIGSETDKNAIEALRSAITAEGYNLNVVCPNTDSENRQKAINASNVALWLTANTDNGVLEIGQTRRNGNLSTINVFAEPVQLSFEQKSIVGRNRSIFSAITEDVDAELVAIFGSNTTSSLPKQPDMETPMQVSATQDTVVSTDNHEGSAPSDDDVDIQVNDADSGISPKSAFIMFIIGWGLEYYMEGLDLRVDEWWPYIIKATLFFLWAGAAGGLMTWRENNGKSFFSALWMWLAGLSALWVSFSFCKDLYNLLFG